MLPVFIVGCERSGTTMLAEHLGRSARVVCLPESQFICENAAADPVSPESAAGLSARFQRHVRFRAWREVGAVPPDLSAEAAVPYRDVVAAFVRSYAGAVGKPDATAFVEHSPANLYRIDDLIRAFPDCRIVNLIRDGRAVTASVLRQDFGPSDVFSAARAWTKAVAVGLAAQNRYGPERMTTVRYEDLVRDIDGQRAALLAFTGLPAAAEGTPDGGSGLRVPSYARDTHALVGKPPEPSRLEAWRTSLTGRRLEVFEAECAALLRHLGYDLTTSEPRPASRLEHLTAAIRGATSHILERIRYRLRHRRLTGV